MTAPSDASSAEIRLIDLEKRFGAVRAVDGVSLDVQPGEFFSLLGPSGCGKTTTLRMIGGFELPTGGRILLRDRDITMDPPDKRPVNMVFQNYALFPHLDVGEQRGLRAEAAQGRRAPTSRDGSARPSSSSASTATSARKPNQLSGGQQQRVALARALVNRPTVLLLDEPLGALDLKLRRQLQVELKRIQHEVGITFVYVTHDQEEALTMSDRIAVMNGGRVEQLGHARGALRAPGDPVRRRLHRHDQPAVAAVDRGRRAVVRLDGGDRAHRARRPRRPGTRSSSASARKSIELVPAGGRPARHPGDGRAGRLPRAPRCPYQVRTAGGLILSVLATKSGRRLPVGSAVAVTWSPSRPSSWRRSGVDRASTRRSSMSHRHDGSTIDLGTRARPATWSRERISRRELLERIAKVGAAAALAPVIAACTSAGATSAPSTAASVAPSASARRCRALGRGRADAGPLARARAVHLQLDRLHRRGHHRVVRGASTGSRSRYDFFSNTEEAYAKLGQRRRRLRHLVPDLGRHPGVRREGRPADRSTRALLPNIVNLGAEWSDPGYDPGNAHSVPYMWWTTGIGYDSTKVTDSPTSSKALWDPRYDGHIAMLDDFQEVFALALIQLGYSANTTDTAQMDQALALLEQQKPLVRVYSTDTSGR